MFHKTVDLLTGIYIMLAIYQNGSIDVLKTKASPEYCAIEKGADS